MATSLPARTSRSPWVAVRGPAMLATFTAALFVSALLLFSVQPMFTKFVLPRLGGSPAVWSTAMVFFQAMLLAGYGYAHLLARKFNVRNGAVVHLLLLAATMLTLPIAAAAGWGRPPESGQAFWLIGLFAVSVGLPFFAVAATGPLLQAWFSRSGHRHAADPYFLYGASNLGSFAALLLYPVVFEPMFALGEQSLLWSFGFVVFVALIGGAALLVLGPAGSGVVSAAPAVRRAWPERLTWVGLAFVPSALLVAVTAHISTDIAAAPFLWVVPLALYLLTFVITFQRKPILPHWLMLRLLPFVVVPLALLVASGVGGNVLLLVGVHLAFFFVAAMACHGELVRLRPPASSLTEFYLWMSFGGVLGGIFSALLAPYLFSTVLEYPILIVASLFALPAIRSAPATLARPFGTALVLTLAALVPAFFDVRLPDNIYAGALSGFAALALVQFRRPVALFAVVGAMVALGIAYQPQAGRSENFRSFFGVNRVSITADGHFRVLFHGRTVHGAERILNDDGSPYVGPPEPTTYYYYGGPLGQAIVAARDVQGTLGRVGLVGLGTGSLACHAKPGESWRLYEIDPEVARIAKTSAYFDFLSDCAPEAPIILGDARLTLSDETDASLNLIVIDAFSSDAVPVHLLTREAFAGYFAKLAPNGILALHISNKYLDLAPVVAASAAANGLGAWLGTSTFSGLDPETLRMGSSVAVVARDVRDVGPLALAPDWKPLSPDPEFHLWSDDYSNILGALLRNFGG